MRRLVAGLVLLTALGLGGFDGLPARAASDDDAAANRLVVEAVRLAGEAGAAADPAARAELLRRALDALDAIVTRHPASGHAARLATGQPIGELDRAAVERRWYVARAEVCVEHREALCVLSLAIELLPTVEHRQQKSWTQMYIAEGRARAGAWEEALKMAHSIALPGLRATGLALVARSLTLSGDPSRALVVLADAVAAIELSDSPFRRSRAFSFVTTQYLEAGDKELAADSLARAIQTSTLLIDRKERAKALAGIAEAQAEAGSQDESRRNFSLALEMAVRIEDSYYRVGALSVIAWSLAETGDKDRAVAVVNQGLEDVPRIPQGPYRDVSHVLLVMSGARAGEIASVRQITASIPSAFMRSLAIAHIANAEALAGDVSGSRRSIAWALDTTGQIDNHAELAEALAFIGWAMSGKPISQ